MLNWTEFFIEQNKKLIISRPRIAKTGGNSRHILINNSQNSPQQLVNFVSNDYLGLSTNHAVSKTLYKACKSYGVGSSGAPSLGGYSQEHQLLAQEMAQYLGFERCLLFSSGYQLNVSLFSQLTDNNTHIWLDKNCHASHIDGIILAKAKFSTFNASSIEQMSNKISQQNHLRHLILSEGTFSMDGSCNYWDKLIELKRAHLNLNNIFLVIDDAHGIGALGNKGHGTLEQLGLGFQHIDLLIGTFGKTFGTHGGFVCGSSDIIDYLQQSVRSQIFSTALPPVIAKASRQSLAIINSSQGTKLRVSLVNKIKHFQKLAADAGLNLYNYPLNQSPIQLLIYSDEQIVIKIHQYLLENDFLVGRMLHPTVPKDKPRLRISLNIRHTKSDVERLINLISQTIYK
ncbi:MAG: putative 8-amino-7-oxononanoate synthase [Pseudomonadota bacterium]|nr:putative 8-amino-7-oxononanoate synthase [Pseudomonadota bacterium]